MPEFFAEPLWDRTTPDGSYLELDELPISPTLRERLRGWSDRFEALALTDYHWESPQVELEYWVEGWRIAGALQQEFGLDVQVLYFGRSGSVG